MSYFEFREALEKEKKSNQGNFWAKQKSAAVFPSEKFLVENFFRFIFYFFLAIFLKWMNSQKKKRKKILQINF